jgi:hypothetical protein
MPDAYVGDSAAFVGEMEVGSPADAVAPPELPLVLVIMAPPRPAGFRPP